MNPSKSWNGQWVWTGGIPRSEYVNEMVCFRRTFHISSLPCQLTVDITADSRYQLYLNGERVCIGPAKGDSYSQFYETIHLSEYLCPGKNVLAVKVLHYSSGGGTSGPISIQRSRWGGFLLDGALTTVDGTFVETLHTDDRWRCIKDPSYKLEYESFMSSNWLGGIERINGALHPHGWLQIDYDDSDWQQAVPFMGTISDYGKVGPWHLTPRSIPFLYERPTVFKGITRFGAAANLQAAYLQAANLQEDAPQDEYRDDLYRLFCTSMDHSSKSGLVFKPETTTWVELDAGGLTTGYLRLEFAGGQGSRIRIQCSECYEKPSESSIRNKNKRDNFSEGQVLLGDSDIYTAAGIAKADSGDKEIYEPFWFRTFRYIKLEIATGEQPLQLHRFFYRETGYPLVAETHFHCSDPAMDQLWTISLNTLQRCMHETYEDCPYYEQLQYTMDTRLQILYHFSISRDDRLARKALRHFHHSRLPSGMLQSRYPSDKLQIIPGFALHWIYMVSDHYLYFGDRQLVKEYSATIDGVLGWFDLQLTPEGLVGPAPKEYWSYIDCVEGWNNGVPTASQHGQITVISMMYAAALKQAADLNREIGRTGIAEEYETRAERVKESVRLHCWSEAKSLYRDGPTAEMYSQHAQMWAVLSGTSSESEANMILTKALDDPLLAKASYSMAFFLFRALSEAGMYDRAYALWEDWHQMVAMHLTTWAEDAFRQRSDCHAWGAAPLYEFPSEIVGVKPDSPGYTRIVVDPKPGKLRWAEGSVITGLGPINVHWRIEGDTFHIQVEGPEKAKLRLIMPDGGTSMYESATSVKASCSFSIKK